MRLETAAVALLLLMAAPGGYTQLPKKFRTKNGVRLHGGVGPKGRVELSSIDSWFNNYSSSGVKPAWNAVCDDAFDDSLALVMCTLLGYSYGRKSYNPKFNYRRNVTLGPPIGKILCEPRKAGPGRRLRGLDATAAFNPSGAVASTAAADSRLSSSSAFLEQLQRERPHQLAAEGSSHRSRSRSLYQPLMGTLNTPPRAPYTCGFYGGTCDVKGPLAGIECSHTPMPAAPPPPPSPPTPPPSPPSLSSALRLVGGRPVDMPDLYPEPNLECGGDEGSCEGFGRVEIQLAASGALIWAPVCAINDNDELASGVQFLVCQQIIDWAVGRRGVVSMPSVDNPFFMVPEGPGASEDDFDPSMYAGWVTILGGASGYSTSVRRVQDLSHKVSTTPCKALLAVQCQVFGASDR